MCNIYFWVRLWWCKLTSSFCHSCCICFPPAFPRYCLQTMPRKFFPTHLVMLFKVCSVLEMLGHKIHVKKCAKQSSLLKLFCPDSQFKVTFVLTYFLTIRYHNNKKALRLNGCDLFSFVMIIMIMKWLSYFWKILKYVNDAMLTVCVQTILH